MRAPAAHRLAWCLLAALAALGVACVGALSSCAVDPGPAPAALIDPAQPWTRHTIYAGLVGADGHALADLDGDGDLDAVAAWEQSARITVSLQPADPRQPWPTAIVATVAGAEDVAIADVDADGAPDVIGCGQGKRVVVAFGDGAGAFAPAVTIAAATGLQQWMQLAPIDTDGDGTPEILAGGRVAYPPRIVALHAGADPRDGAAWTLEEIGPTGWTMALVARDVDGDGDADLLVSDRQWYALAPPPAPRQYDLQGLRWIEHAGSSWINHQIAAPPATYSARFLADAGSWVLAGWQTEAGASLLQARAGWGAWAAAPVPWPKGLGGYHAADVGDVDGDGIADLVVAADAAVGTLEGVAWLRAPTWERHAIGGPEGEKFDRVELIDLDRDGRADVVTTEQNEGLGLIWYERP